MTLHFLCLVTVLAGTDAQGQLQDIVAAHTSSVESIQRVETDLEAFILSPGGVWKPSWNYYWAMDGQVERQKFVDLTGPSTDEDGRPINLGDLLQTPEDTKILLNWDWRSPQKLTPHNQGTVKAVSGPRIAKCPTPFPNPIAQFACFQFQARIDDINRSLGELARDSPTVRITGTRVERGISLVMLDIAHPDTRSGGPFSRAKYTIGLERDKGYLARLVICEYPNDSARKEADWSTCERWIDEFEEVEAGLYFPKQTTLRVTSNAGGAAGVSIRVSARNLRVNKPLSSDALLFRFPANALVRSTVGKNGKALVQLWGAENRPIKEINGPEDLGPLTDDPYNPTSGVTTMRVVYGASAAIAVSLIAILIWRRLRR